MTGDFSVRGPTITLMVVTGISLDASVDTNVTLALEGMGGSPNYHNVGGRIYERQTNPAVPTEVEDGTSVSVFFRNRSGGASSSSNQVSYSRSSGYGVITGVFGSDCLVAAAIRPPGKKPFNVVVASVDLSSPSTTLDLTQDLQNTTQVTVSGDVGNIGTVYLASPYGNSPAGFYEFTSSSSAQIDITNPFGYPGVWTQMKFISDYPIPGYRKIFLCASNEASIGTSVTLPVIDYSMGPTGVADPSTLSYSSATGVLSVSPAAGAQFYSFSLRDNITNEAMGSINSSSATVTLPQWLRSQLAGKSIIVGIQPMVTKMAGGSTIFDLQTLSKFSSNASTVTPGVALTMVVPNGSNTKVIQF